MVFRNHIEPAFCVTWELDITRFLQQVRKQHLSFTLAMVYAVSACANQIEEFRYRFIEGDVVLFDKIDTAFTYLDRETELFKVVHVPLQGSLPGQAHLPDRLSILPQRAFCGDLPSRLFPPSRVILKTGQKNPA